MLERGSLSRIGPCYSYSVLTLPILRIQEDCWIEVSRSHKKRAVKMTCSFLFCYDPVNCS